MHMPRISGLGCAGLKAFLLDLPEGAKLNGDKAYNDYEMEDLLTEFGYCFWPLRKNNSSGHRRWF